MNVNGESTVETFKPEYNRHIKFRKKDHDIDVFFSDNGLKMVTDNGCSILPAASVNWVINKVCGEGFKIILDTVLTELVNKINSYTFITDNPTEEIQSLLPNDLCLSTCSKAPDMEVYIIQNCINEPVITAVLALSDKWKVTGILSPDLLHEPNISLKGISNKTATARKESLDNPNTKYLGTSGFKRGAELR